MIISKCLLVIMTMIICTSVFFRYVLNTGLSWTDEVSMLFMVWFGFISVSYGVKENLHISVELFYNMFPKKMKWVCVKFNYLVIFILGGLLAYNSYGLMQTTMTNFMTATRWPTAVRYAPVGICGVFMCFYAFRHMISKLEIEDKKPKDKRNKEDSAEESCNLARDLESQENKESKEKKEPKEKKEKKPKKDKKKEDET